MPALIALSALIALGPKPATSRPRGPSVRCTHGTKTQAVRQTKAKAIAALDRLAAAVRHGATHRRALRVEFQHLSAALIGLVTDEQAVLAEVHRRVSSWRDDIAQRSPRDSLPPKRRYIDRKLEEYRGSVRVYVELPEERSGRRVDLLRDGAALSEVLRQLELEYVACIRAFD